MALVTALLARALSLVLPPRCPGCGAMTDADHRFCGPCWTSLEFLGPPWCAQCAAPFVFDRGEGALCGDCLAAPPPYHGVFAAVAYGTVAKRLALRLKYGGRTGFAETAARLMARHLPDDADLLVPVPLHRWRLWSRGYNQAQLIAHALARPRGLPVAGTVLRRVRATPSLRGLGRKGRVKAVKGAFAVSPSRRAVVAGRHVILVDDVYTSGATATACANALLRSGAASVRVVCWARVIGESGD